MSEQEHHGPSWLFSWGLVATILSSTPKGHWLRQWAWAFIIGMIAFFMGGLALLGWGTLLRHQAENCQARYDQVMEQQQKASDAGDQATANRLNNQLTELAKKCYK